jgi:hypothetical protein
MGRTPSSEFSLQAAAWIRAKPLIFRANPKLGGLLTGGAGKAGVPVPELRHSPATALIAHCGISENYPRSLIAMPGE